MNRIDTRTVELTETEGITQELFESYLDRGTPTPFAAKLALNRIIDEEGTA